MYKILEASETIVVLDSKKDSMIEVFVTNVNKESEAEVILSKLRKRFPEVDFNLDLEDCDKVLRVEGIYFNIEEIQTLLRINGFVCDVMTE